jgi:hypothetical protein
MPNAYDHALYFLDMGMMHFYSGNYAKSNDLLTKAEIAIENNFTKSITQHSSSYILDDRIMNYYGEDYEDIYLNVFKAINYFNLKNMGAAGVELRRVNEKLEVLQDKYNTKVQQLNRTSEIQRTKRKIVTNPVNFHNSALSRYLSSIYYRFEKQYDDARIDIQHIYDAFTQQQSLYDYQMPRHLFDLYQCLSRNTPQSCLAPNRTMLYFIAFTGRSPVKIAKTYWIITRKNCIIIAQKKNGSGQMDVIPWPGVKSGYFFKFSLPYMQKRKNNVEKIVAFIDQTPVILEQLEDLANIAIETFNLKKNMIYLKTIIRATVKGILAEKLKKNIGKKKLDEKSKKREKQSLGELLFNETKKGLIDFAIDATENADLRISSFFPGKAYSGNLVIRPGAYHVSIVYYDSRNKPLKKQDLGKQIISQDGLNIIQSSYYGVH